MVWLLIIEHGPGGKVCYELNPKTSSNTTMQNNALINGSPYS